MFDVDYLDRLAADQIDAGFDLTGEDIKSAAAEIRRLRLVVANYDVQHRSAWSLENAATVPSLNDALTYIVTWRIDLTAKTPHEAVRRAREIQLDPNNTATFFEVAIEHELQNTPQGENK